MNEDFFIVPWYNSQEWHQAYHYIYSDTPNKIKALNLLRLWKVRCPALPSGVESTLTLLEVHVQDTISFDDTSNDHLLRLAYSSAIIRFVNHTLDTESAKGNTLYQSAKNMGLPDWIVELRHDTAHHNTLPSLTLLRHATFVGLEWLQNNYWLKQKDHIGDYLSGIQETDNNVTNSIGTLMNFCVSLSFCAHSVCKIKNIADIPNPSMRESLVNDIKDLFGNDIKLVDLHLVTISSLIETLNSQSQRWLKGNNIKKYVNTALLGDDSLILSLELLEFMSGKYFKRTKKLKKQYVQCFEVLITFLHTSDLLFEFILTLIRVTQSLESSYSTALLAALWVSEILTALLKSKKFINKINVNNAKMSQKPKKEMKSLYYHWFPGDKVCGLTLNLNKPIPAELTDMNFIKPIISAYNPYLTYFVKDMLNLVEPQIPDTVINKICALAKLISGTSVKLVTSSNKIYTVDDLKTETYDLTEHSENKEQTDYEEICPPPSEFINGIWTLVTNKHDWAKCPIGQLPWKKDSQTEMEIVA